VDAAKPHVGLIDHGMSFKSKEVIISQIRLKPVSSAGDYQDIRFGAPEPGENTVIDTSTGLCQSGPCKLFCDHDVTSSLLLHQNNVLISKLTVWPFGFLSMSGTTEKYLSH